MVALRDRQHLGDALDSLASALESLEIGSTLPELSADRDRLASTIRTYLMPRVDDPSTPLTVVFAGPTGSGKSTLINSVVGSNVTDAGVLRPTTRAPLVVVSPAHAYDYARFGSIDCDVITGRAPILEKMAVVDTPDIDSTLVMHRAMAETLVDNADIVVFVASALRYADAVPWQVLRRAVARGTDVIQVLNRVGSATAGAAVDFKSRLRSEGMSNDVVTIPEYHSASDDQSLPLLAVKALRNRLTEIALARGEAAGATFDRVLAAIIVQVRDLAGAIDEVIDGGNDLEASISVDLSERLGQLTLSGVADGLYTQWPKEETRWRLGRWKRDNRREDGKDPIDLQPVIDRSTERIEAALRRWLSEKRRDAGGGTDLSAGDFRQLIRCALEGWTDYVWRIGEESDFRNRWVTTAVLIDAATRGEVVRPASVLLGEEAPVLVDRAERELWNRLEVVYEQVAVDLASSVRPGSADLDESDVRSALGAVTVAAAPVYA